MKPGFRRGLSALILALTCLSGATAILSASAPARAGSLTLEALSSDQRSRILARLDQLAFFESGARVCGRPTSLETRLRAAAADCVAPQTLDDMMTTFRQKMNAATSTFDRNAYCGDPRMPTILTSFHESTNELVSKVEAMCKACQVTGMCK